MKYMALIYNKGGARAWNRDVMQTSNRRVLITGGGTGIGLEITRAFLAAGSEVIAAGRNIKTLERARRELPEMKVHACDVTKDDDVCSLLAYCENIGGIDTLINNAGVFHSGRHGNADYSLASQLADIETNVSGTVRMVHHFLPSLACMPKPAIVNVSSCLAFVPFIQAPVYSATKAALHSWTRSLRRHLADTDVRVFELLPPPVDTEMTRDLEGISKMTPEKHARVFMKGFAGDQYEIVPGIGKALAFMSRVAPGFIFRALNKDAKLDPIGRAMG